ncbi:class I SAM-dependent methyltransferase [Erythrobacter sp. AP23]|uniref:class I SAM-dependent methyltransferase n=1 Tax=Erythrobacter sp. AP23 TaxID=499656 RepID=UPI00076DECB8|nr:class I SAM-dependent methyltransferase [Erythrobacter sp. AP23]KWV95450.1 hypothetical protein ASS64_05520 [Erythrobacter sp. AP23]
MDKQRKDAVWKDFWAAQNASSAPAVVSTQWDAITRAQFDVWTDFLREVKGGAKVLDIATGAGKVLHMMRATRPDLELYGIDIAQDFPDPPHKTKLVGGVHMEEMPFDDGQFDVVVSQFGFEYGDTEAGAKEILRVLHAEGRMAFMVHRGDGPIVAHNRKRIEQISWLRDENSLFSRIVEMIPVDSSISQEAYDFAKDLAARGERKFGLGSVAWEIPEAVRRTLILGAKGSREKLIGTLDLIEEQAESEVDRIRSLLVASAAADEREKLLEGFTKQGREALHCTPVSLSKGEVFADLIVL